MNFWDGYGYLGCNPQVHWNLSSTSPAQVPDEPLTVADAKAFLRLRDGIEPDDTEDALIGRMCAAARRAAEFIQARDLVMCQREMTARYWPDYFIELRTPLVSVDLVQKRDSTGTTSDLSAVTDYAVDFKARIPLLFPRPDSNGNYQHWPHFKPWPSSAVLIRVTSGMAPNDQWWANEGDHVLQGMRYLVHHFFNNRDAFNRGIGNIEEFPFTVTQLLSFGSIARVP